MAVELGDAGLASSPDGRATEQIAQAATRGATPAPSTLQATIGLTRAAIES